MTDNVVKYADDELLPYTTNLLFEELPVWDGEQLEFRLIYAGPLPSQGSGDSRAREKHAIRKALHPQLKELWSQVPALKMNLDFYSQQFARCGFRFVPLINSAGSHPHHCRLDILFLRRDAPGNLIKTGGDIDNRIKVLFDGLRIVDNLGELGGATPDADEDPFFCLLEDDNAITEVNITTDRLLTPLGSGHIHDVVLIIRVRTPLLDALDRRPLSGHSRKPPLSVAL